MLLEKQLSKYNKLTFASSLVSLMENTTLHYLVKLTDIKKVQGPDCLEPFSMNNDKQLSHFFLCF